MNFDGFLGNLRIKQYLTSCIRKSTLPQALIITGAKGIGKKTLADIIAKALVCLSDNERPCGVCNSCRKADIGLHPDIKKIGDTDETGHNIGVDYIRGLKIAAYTLPNESDRKVYVFEKADSLGDKSQDALLKILEDTPVFTFFVFICYNQNSLLETIRSRCTVLELSPLNESDVTAVLKKHLPDADKHKLTMLAIQSGGIAGAVLDESESAKYTEHALSIAGALSEKDELSVLKALSSIEKLPRKELIEVLSALKIILRDALMHSFHMDSMSINQNTRKVSELLSKTLHKEKVLAIIELIDASQRILKRNIGPAHITGSLACRLALIVK